MSDKGLQNFYNSNLATNHFSNNSYAYASYQYGYSIEQNMNGSLDKEYLLKGHIIVRRATIADLMPLSDIELRSAKHEKRLYPLNFTLDEMYELWYQRYMSGEYDILVSCIKDKDSEIEKVTGFIAARAQMYKEGFVQAIYVDPLYYHQGIGQALMEYIEKIMQKNSCTHIKLYLEPGNRVGFKFYSKLGFKKYHKKYRHLHIMVKELRAC